MASASARVISACLLAAVAAAAQDDGCSGVIALLSPCLRVLNGSGSLLTPPASCCSALEAVGVDPVCVIIALAGINNLADRSRELLKGCTYAATHGAGPLPPCAESDVLDSRYFAQQMAPIIFAAALAFLFIVIAVVDVYSEQTVPRTRAREDV